jgi:glucokinase
MQEDFNRNNRPLRVGVDVGGTKIIAAVIDNDGEVLSQVKIPTDTSQPEMTLHSIATAIEQGIQAAGTTREMIRGIGLGIPGKVDPRAGKALLAVNLGWRDIAVSAWLENYLGLPCVLENDVSAATLGEYHYGAGNPNMVYFSLGTGLAARVISEGHLYQSAHGLSGEIGHMIFAPGGPRCSCGGLGCLEALAAGPALARNAEALLRSGEPSSLQASFVQAHKVSTEQLFSSAGAGDILALRVLDDAAEYLAQAIALLGLNFDPHLIILGGGLALEEGPFTIAIRRAVDRWLAQTPILREILTPDRLRLTELGRNGALLGAAALVDAN